MYLAISHSWLTLIDNSYLGTHDNAIHIHIVLTSSVIYIYLVIHNGQRWMTVYYIGIVSISSAPIQLLVIHHPFIWLANTHATEPRELHAGQGFTPNSPIHIRNPQRVQYFFVVQSLFFAFTYTLTQSHSPFISSNQSIVNTFPSTCVFQQFPSLLSLPRSSQPKLRLK